MNPGNPEFWKEQLKGIDVSGIGYERRLSSTDLDVIRQRYNALSWREEHREEYGLASIDIKADTIQFAQKLGGTDEEIEFEVLPELGFIVNPILPTGSKHGFSIMRMFSRLLHHRSQKQ